MAALTDAKSVLTKAIVLGDSGTGKTGGTISLLQAGYKLRFLDLDNKLQTGIFPQLIRKHCPDKMGNVDYEAVRDKFKASALGPIFDGMPKAFTRSLELMDKWSDGTIPSKWGPEYIFIIDSLTFLSDAAYNWAKALNPQTKDPRQWFYTAQQAVENTLAMLTAETFHTNLLVIAHVSWQTRPDGSMKGYPASVGKALGPTIPTYFDNMVLCQTSSDGKSRTIQTVPTALVDLKNPASINPAMLPTLPLETGLATFFETLRK